jgi:hemoglobin
LVILYEKIGGKSKIVAAVDLFYRKVLADRSLRQFFEHVDMDHLRSRQAMFLTMLVGARKKYTGKDLGTAHARPRGEGMNEEHFTALLNHFQKALEEVGIEREAVTEIIERLEGTRDAVLGRLAH